jgi:hypothetical protein
MQGIRQGLQQGRKTLLRHIKPLIPLKIPERKKLCKKIRRERPPILRGRHLSTRGLHAAGCIDGRLKSLSPTRVRLRQGFAGPNAQSGEASAKSESGGSVACATAHVTQGDVVVAPPCASLCSALPPLVSGYAKASPDRTHNPAKLQRSRRVGDEDREFALCFGGRIGRQSSSCQFRWPATRSCAKP